MTDGAKFTAVSAGLFVLVVAGMLGRQYYLNHHDSAADKPVVLDTFKIDDDDVVLAGLHKEHPSDLKDIKSLTGHTVWMSAGYQMDYYKDSGNHVDFAHRVDTIPGAQEMLVKGAFEQATPSTGRAIARIPGPKHVLLAVTFPKSDNPTQLYAFPVGTKDATGYTFYTDNILFYDDPHKLYSKWSPEVWQHIDKHEAALGMTENQAMMALGQVINPHGDKAGDRVVDFNNNEHPLTIDFRGGKAVKITPGT